MNSNQFIFTIIDNTAFSKIFLNIDTSEAPTNWEALKIFLKNPTYDQEYPRRGVLGVKQKLFRWKFQFSK